MMTVELRVNGILIAMTTVVREQRTLLKEAEQYAYSVEHYEPTKGITEGLVTHNYEDGALALAHKALGNILKKRKKEKI